MANEFGNRVRALREERGWSQEQLARLAGVPASWLAMVELGVSDQPSAESLSRLADAFGISVQTLAIGEGSMAAAEPASGVVRLPVELARDLQDIIDAGERSEQARRMIRRFSTTLRELFLDGAGPERRSH